MTSAAHAWDTRGVRPDPEEAQGPAGRERSSPAAARGEPPLSGGEGFRSLAAAVLLPGGARGELDEFWVVHCGQLSSRPFLVDIRGRLAKGPAAL